MKVLFLGSQLVFSLIPSQFPANGDILLLSLRNEMTDFVINPDFTFSITDKLDITITTQPNDFKSQNKYEVELKNDSETIYLGKIIVLDINTDVQNYEYGSQTNSRFEYK